MRKPRYRFLPESLMLAVPEIDAEHEGIFHRLAGLKDVGLAANRLDADTAEQLLDQLRGHFATEERLAQAAQGDFTKHSEEHDDLLHTVGKLLDMTRDGQANVFGLLRYVALCRILVRAPHC